MKKNFVPYGGFAVCDSEKMKLVKKQKKTKKKLVGEGNGLFWGERVLKLLLVFVVILKLRETKMCFVYFST